MPFFVYMSVKKYKIFTIKLATKKLSLKFQNY